MRGWMIYRVSPRSFETIELSQKWVIATSVGRTVRFKGGKKPGGGSINETLRNLLFRDAG